VHGYFNVANYYYVIRFAFYDDGTIEPSLGASGSLQRYIRNASTGWPVRGLIAANHNHWVIWRADFDLDGAAGDVVKQFDGVGGLRTTTLLTETKVQHDLSQARFWRVYGDAGPHALAYEIVPNVTDVYRADESFTHNDFYWTQNHADEALVSDAFGLAGFVNEEAVQDGVVWYGVNFHHVPRAEDDVRMPIHWQGFAMRLHDRGWAARLFMPLMWR
jgi:primary-amine oxidase